MTTVSAAEVRTIVEAVLAELWQAAPSAPAEATTAAAPSHSPTNAGAPEAPPATSPQSAGGVRIEVTDPTTREMRHRIGVHEPANPSGLANMVASTSARLGVGRAGPRPKTGTLLLFGADHAVTQDTIFGDVPTALLEQLGLFTVQTMVTGREEFLLRPDLGRLLSEEAKQVVEQRCVKNPQVQIVVGDGLSAAAVTNNLPQIYPVIDQGLQAAGLTVGTPFFVRYARVGVINDINDIVQADVVALLIGERPGLGVADALSVYSGWRPTAGKTDVHRDVTCMITENGGTNPLEAGAFVVAHIRNVVAHQASGVELRLQQAGAR